MLNIKLLVLDVDGTLTDGKIHISANGELYKSFNVKDGMGINEIIRKGVIVAIITGRYSEIASIRAKELNINHIYQNVSDKKAKLIELSSNLSIPFERIAYIGDDINDLEPMKMVGLAMCPSDAIDEIKEITNYCSKDKGGEGAVRDCINYIIRGG